MEKYAAGGWVTGIKYEDELRDMLKERTSGKDDEVRSSLLRACSTACMRRRFVKIGA